MSNREDRIRLRHMLDHASETTALMHGKQRSELDRSRVLQLALIRLIEIIGEAANGVSKETQAKHPSIPWAQVVGMRNRLVHGYDFVDLDILWQTVHQDLPPLIAALERIMAQEQSG